MKRIIEGKSYNTETATELARAHSSNANHGDFSFWREILYQSKSGAFFLHGEGGPQTSWGRSCGQNSWIAGDGMRLLTDTEAREWVERYANASYEEIFGPAVEA